MPYVAIRCPQCAGDLKLNDKFNLGYCMYCDTPVYFKDVSAVTTMSKADYLIELIKKDMYEGLNQTLIFKDRLNEALELDSSNQFLYSLYTSQIWNAEIKNGSLVKYTGTAEKFIVPTCISSIHNGAFYNCYRLKELTLPNTVTFIGDYILHFDYNVKVHAYLDSFAAQYAMSNHVNLHLIDAPDDIQQSISSIKESLSELLFLSNSKRAQYKKNSNVQTNGAIFIFIVFLALVVMIFSMVLFVADSLFDTISFFIFFILVCVFSMFQISMEVHMNNKLHTKNKATLTAFYKKCNKLLKPIGIIDFKYMKNICCDHLDFLHEDAKALKAARNKIMHLPVTIDS